MINSHAQEVKILHFRKTGMPARIPWFFQTRVDHRSRPSARQHLLKTGGELNFSNYFIIPIARGKKTLYVNEAYAKQ